MFIFFVRVLIAMPFLFAAQYIWKHSSSDWGYVWIYCIGGISWLISEAIGEGMGER